MCAEINYRPGSPDPREIINSGIDNKKDITTESPLRNSQPLACGIGGDQGSIEKKEESKEVQPPDRPYLRYIFTYFANLVTTFIEFVKAIFGCFFTVNVNQNKNSEEGNIKATTEDHVSESEEEDEEPHHSENTKL